MAVLQLLPREAHVPADVPRAGLVINTLLSMVTIAALAVCLTRRIEATVNWSKVPVTRWLLFAIYTDSIVFIMTTATLEHGFGLNLNMQICSAAILLCLVCYMTTKLIYYFLVEKVYIIRRVQTPRLQSKLYCFNCFGMLLPYCVVVILNFIYRISYFDDNGTCIIGMQKKAMMPLIIFDAVVNFYLTLLFVIPLRSLYSYKNSPNSSLRTVALRSFVGSLATLTSSVVNLTILMVLKGEAAWICLMCCNADILFSVLVLHWVTSKDSSTTASIGKSNSAAHGSTHASKSGGIVANKLAKFSYSSKQPTVITHISAVKASEEDEDDTQRMDWDLKEGARREADGFTMGRITVQVGQVVEVERERSSESSSTRYGEEAARAKDVVSTEDLVGVPKQH